MPRRSATASAAAVPLRPNVTVAAGCKAEPDSPSQHYASVFPRICREANFFGKNRFTHCIAVERWRFTWLKWAVRVQADPAPRTFRRHGAVTGTILPQKNHWNLGIWMRRSSMKDGGSRVEFERLEMRRLMSDVSVSPGYQDDTAMIQHCAGPGLSGRYDQFRRRGLSRQPDAQPALRSHASGGRGGNAQLDGRGGRVPCRVAAGRSDRCRARHRRGGRQDSGGGEPHRQ